MKRCGIFVFYNEDGIVGSYVEILLKSMKEILEELIIVVNGMVREDEETKLYQYSKRIFYRSNIGYDGGAYKDTFFKFLDGNINWKEMDEIVLFNDTFYGPFFQLHEVFNIMKQRKCDFWGLTSHSGGASGLFNGKMIPPHLQSYFLVLKRNVFTHSGFLRFWSELQYPNNYKSAVMNFEICFTRYLLNLGFYYESWLELQKEQMESGVNWDIDNFELMLTEFRFPILKKKKCVLQNYATLKRGFQYIVKNTTYPIDVIVEDILYRSEKGKIKPYNPKKILEFCENYKKIFLFGNGVHAYNIEQFIIDNGKSIDGYIVSKVEGKTERIFSLKEFIVKSDVGIIVALNQKNFIEVRDRINKIIPADHLITPLYEIYS